MFARLRDMFGQLSFLDTVFARADGKSWDTIPLAVPAGDEMFATSTGFAGSLDAVFLELGELSDDLCGLQSTSRVDCTTLSAGGLAALNVDTVPMCAPTPGSVERNPNPFYPGLFGRHVGDPTSSAYAMDPFSVSDGDFDTTFGAGTDDSFAHGGLLSEALVGTRIEGTTNAIGVETRSGLERVCVPRDPTECRGVAAIPIPGATPGMPASAVLSDSPTEVDSTQSGGGCPSIAPGARLRYTEGSQVPAPALLPMVTTPPIVNVLNGSPVITPIPFDLRTSGVPAVCVTTPPDGGFDAGDVDAGTPASSDAGVVVIGLPDGATVPDGSCINAPVPVGCCSGYSPVPCTSDIDCADYGQVGAAPVEGGGGFIIVSSADCRGGFCARPSSDCTPFASDPRAVSCADTAWVCVPDSCLHTDPMYCLAEADSPTAAGDEQAALLDSTDTIAQLCPAGTAGTACQTAVSRAAYNRRPTGFSASLMSTTASMIRAGACGPGSRCAEAPTTVGNPPLVRPFAGHHAARLALLAALAGSVASSSSGSSSSATGPVSIGDLYQLLTTAILPKDVSAVTGIVVGNPRIGGVSLNPPPDFTYDPHSVSDVSIRWQGRSDGDLPLPGYLVLTVTTDPPDLHVSSEGFGLSVPPFRLQIEMQPYFYAAAPPVSTCDGCARRLPDMTMHMHTVEAALYHQMDDTLLGHDDVGGCGADVLNCAISCGCLKRTLTLGDVELHSAGDVPAAVDAALYKGIASVEPDLDQLIWYMLADPTVGGYLLGRPAAVDRIRDAPLCDVPAAGGVPTSVVTNRDCRVTSPAGTSQQANTIESLGVTDGAAVVRGRDDPLLFP